MHGSPLITNKTHFSKKKALRPENIAKQGAEVSVITCRPSYGPKETWQECPRQEYKNGVHVGSSTIDFHDSGHGRGTDGYALGSYSTGNNVYKGSYGIFKYYNRNLSDAEVMQNFNSERNRFGK